MTDSAFVSAELSSSHVLSSSLDPNTVQAVLLDGWSQRFGPNMTLGPHVFATYSSSGDVSVWSVTDPLGFPPSSVNSELVWFKSAKIDVFNPIWMMKADSFGNILLGKVFVTTTIFSPVFIELLLLLLCSSC
jgi:hypothetical protein